MKLTIHNVRLGHATNSSSSHSIVIAPPNNKYRVSTERFYDGNLEFGWDNFVLADENSKLHYLAAQLFSSLTTINGLTPEIAAATIKGWLDFDVGDVSGKWIDIGIDHQSALCFPVEGLNKEFIDQFANFFKNDRIVIYGGNDNDDPIDINPSFKSISFFDTIRDNRSMKYARLKKDGKFWILYNKSTGAKLRFSFDPDDVDAESYTKSTTPELVDIKITNKCNFGCDFCYQSSTKDGEHASLQFITQTLYGLSEMDVFEVAIGGGEPTTHPDFVKILKRCVKQQIKPNFTTYSRAWLKNEEIVQAVKDYVGGIGVSIHSIKDLKKINDIAKVINGSDTCFGNIYDGSKVSIMGQHVVGTHPLEETVKIIDEAWNKDIPVLLLGYKNVGFGNTFQSYDMSGIEVALKLIIEKNQNEYHSVSLSVDTAFLELYPKIVDILDISNVLTTSPEGAFSMYMDLVDKKMAKSSYVNKNDMISLLNPRNKREFVDSEYILNNYSKW